LAKITFPVLASQHFGVPSERFAELGVLEPTLNVDIKLFIDPLLLAHSRHSDFGLAARSAYEDHFRKVIGLLAASRRQGDPAWTAAFKKLEFPEVKNTCLGYGGDGIAGSGSGGERTMRAIQTAKEIIELGVDDPDLFVSMALLEEGIGPDRISDMTSNVILSELGRFTEWASTQLAIPTSFQTIRLRTGRHISGRFPLNAAAAKPCALLLVPSDILRALPVAADFDAVSEAAAHNESLRNQVNEDIGSIFAKTTLEAKSDMRRWALASKQNFDELLTILNGIAPEPYNFRADPAGEILWARLAQKLADIGVPSPKMPAANTREGLTTGVEEIIDYFADLIEKNRLSEELYHLGKPKHERSAQRIFFAVASTYCRINRLDISPEANAGAGPVDFKISNGSERIVVELKLSTNGKLVQGFTKQTEAYAAAENALGSYYVVLDVGRMGGKLDKVFECKNEAARKGEKVPELKVIDATRRASASLL